MKLILKYYFLGAIVLSSTIGSMPAKCSAIVERDAVFMEKHYNNGDSIELKCPDVVKLACELRVGIGKERRTIEVDFEELGTEARMNTLKLFVTSTEDFVFLVEVDVKCREQDLQAFEGQPGNPECIAGFEVENGKLKWSIVQIFSVSDTRVYNDVSIAND